jgi:carboxylesterase
MKQNEFMVNPHLEGDDFYWEGSQTGVLLIHGFTATTAEVRLIAEMLHEDGYTCAAPLLPGHGTNPDDLNRATWGMWLEKVKGFYERLARDCEKVFVIGESMGTLLALELAFQHPEINGIMLFSPAIKVNGLWLSRIMQLFKDHLEKSSEDDGLPWKGYNVYPVKAAAEFHKLQGHVKNHLPKIEQPTLVFTGEYDTQISSDAAEIILDGIKSENKQHIHMKDSPHVILLANELDKAYEHIVEFIKRQS